MNKHLFLFYPIALYAVCNYPRLEGEKKRNHNNLCKRVVISSYIVFLFYSIKNN